MSAVAISLFYTKNTTNIVSLPPRTKTATPVQTLRFTNTGKTRKAKQT